MSVVDADYLAEFEVERKANEDQEQQALSGLREFRDATVDLYSFVAANKKHVRIDGDRLVFPDSTMKTKFEDKQKRSIDLLHRVQTITEEQAKQQEKALPIIPLSELGLHDDQPPSK